VFNVSALVASWPGNYVLDKAVSVKNLRASVLSSVFSSFQPLFGVSCQFFVILSDPQHPAPRIGISHLFGVDARFLSALRQCFGSLIGIGMG
jgi:hypothetical protein